MNRFVTSDKHRTAGAVGHVSLNQSAAFGVYSHGDSVWLLLASKGHDVFLPWSTASALAVVTLGGNPCCCTCACAQLNQTSLGIGYTAYDSKEVTNSGTGRPMTASNPANNCTHVHTQLWGPQHALVPRAHARDAQVRHARVLRWTEGMGESRSCNCLPIEGRPQNNV